MRPDRYPVMLHFRYAFPCADIRKDQGTLSDDDYASLHAVARKKQRPSRELLARAFPNAFEGIKENARTHGLGLWSYENIAGYWRYAHTHESSPVLHGTAVRCLRRSTEISLWSVHVNDSVIDALDIYRLPIEEGSDVTLHQNVIIEVLPSD